MDLTGQYRLTEQETIYYNYHTVMALVCCCTFVCCCTLILVAKVVPTIRSNMKRATKDESVS